QTVSVALHIDRGEHARRRQFKRTYRRGGETASAALMRARDNRHSAREQTHRTPEDIVFSRHPAPPRQRQNRPDKIALSTNLFCTASGPFPTWPVWFEPCHGGM